MVDTPSAPFGPDEELGPTLARMRKAKKLTGIQLARMVGMSQPKISRLENGIGLPDPNDVGQIARALGAGDEQVFRLIEVAEQVHNRMTDWRSLRATLASIQQEINRIELEAKTFRVFQSAVVVGLLQTSEYARAILYSFRFLARRSASEHVSAAPDTAAEYDIAVPEAVSARVKRQEILGDRERRFNFIMTEAVLDNYICPPEEMAAQIQRIRQVSSQENVKIGIIPAGTKWILPPMHAFDILDEQIVTIDLLNTGIASQGRADVRTYGQIFDTFEEQATTDIDPILDRYLDRYLDQARPRRRR